MVFNIFVINLNYMKNLIIATLFIAFGAIAFWNNIPAYFESGKYLFQLPFMIVWKAKFEAIFAIVMLVGFIKLTNKI